MQRFATDYAMHVATQCENDVTRAPVPVRKKAQAVVGSGNFPDFAGIASRRQASGLPYHRVAAAISSRAARISGGVTMYLQQSSAGVRSLSCCRRSPLAVALSALCGALAPTAVLAQATTQIELSTVNVIGTAPIPGVERKLEHIPANVRHISDKALDDTRQTTLTDALGTLLPGVTINETQGNPYQPDFNYRGFSASPLLGAAQGLSVFVDGVRANTPFGDTVNWDMIPQVAIEDITVIPGSNPLFGLNTLGGAVTVRTKDGFSYKGFGAEAKAGSFGRRALEVEYGGNNGSVGYYVAASGFHDNGWRDYSGSDLGQFFGKLSWRGEASDLDLSLAHGDSHLIGNGLLPRSMMDSRYRQIFTHSDLTKNQQTQLALSGSRWFGDDARLSGNLYLRTLRSRSLNSDLDENFAGGPHDLAAAGDGLNADSGVNNRTRSRQDAWGGALQYSRSSGAHQWALGASVDVARMRFSQLAEEGYISPSRGIVATDDEVLVNKLSGRSRTASVYATDTWELAEAWHLTASARYNHTHVENDDKLNPVAPNLDADYTWHKLNPSLGLTWQAAPALNLYTSYNQGNRAPTPIELGCADRANPCSLPNAMAADPYLKQVVTRTIELGARGKLGAKTQWSVAAYRSNNHDDILFVGTGTSMGYFTNFGKTRRDGLELALDGTVGSVDWNVAYGYIRATFQSGACLFAENNSSAGSDPACAADEIRVRSGDRMPGIPEHSFKLGGMWRLPYGVRIGGDAVAYSSQYLRGNENNAHVASSRYDRGTAGGYAIFNLKGDWQIDREWQLFGRVDNVFDRRYATGGALRDNPFDASGAFQTDSSTWRSEALLAPGTPRSFWLGVRYRLAGS